MNVSYIVTKRIHKKGQTVSGFAKANGFKTRTVFELFYSQRYRGTRGIGRQIVETLYKDGFITKREYGLIPESTSHK